MVASFRSLGIQSWSLRAFSENREVAAKIKECGLNAVELCDIHVDFGRPETFGEVIAAYRESQVEILSIGVATLAADRVHERNLFDFMRASGAQCMNVTFEPETFEQALVTAQGLADQYDVRLAIHNHGGRDWLGSARMLQYVLSQCNERIGLCLDTGWALDSGEDPVAMARQFAGRVYGIHVKDFTFDRAGKPTDVVAGSGNLDLAELKAVLGQKGFDGYAAIEYEGDVNAPAPAITRCVEAVKKAWT